MVSSHLRRVTLHPGEYRVSGEPVVLSTLLGSCVAVCLYDRDLGVMGMNHFLLANPRYPKQAPIVESDAGRYGIHAMELLVNALLHAGARRARLEAKAFGGGNVVAVPDGGRGGRFSVGEVNVRFVREFFQRDAIPLVASDLGGDYGRQIHFDGSDYAVYMRRIVTTEVRQIEREETRYLEESLEEQRRREADARAEFW